MVQLARKQQVIEHRNFEKLGDGINKKEFPIEIYVDKMLMGELETNGMNIVVDLRTWKRFGSLKKELTLIIEN